jgi:protein phosphatase
MSLISIPASALVILIGPAGAGKSSFASRHFPPEAVISTDAHRQEVAGDRATQGRNDQVFERIHELVEQRAAAGLLTVIDATNTRGPLRTEFTWHAHRHHRSVVAIALHLPLETCLAQNAGRAHPVPARVIRQQFAELRHLDTDLELEQYDAVHRLRSRAQVDASRVVIGNGMAS